MSLLCATNFSAEASAAATVAAELARRRGEPLWLVYVAPADAGRIYGERALAVADERLKDEAARLRALGAGVTPALLVGKLHRVLPRFAADNQVTLVLAGDAPGRATDSRALARLGRSLEAPLMAVRRAEPWQAWLRGERPLKVVVGLDHTRSTAVAAHWVEALARVGPLDVVGAHVFFPAAEAHRLGLPLPRTWDEAHPELLASLQRELSARLPPSVPHRLSLHVAIGRVSDHLTAMAEAEHADLLVLGTHHRQALGRLWSVSEHCLTQAPMSVVCVPAAAGANAGDAKIADVGRILIATDFTPAADRAIAWGLGAVSPGGAVDLVHVSGEPLSPEAEARVVEHLRARIPPEARARGLEVRVHALAGATPAAAILAAAERFDSAVVCLATRSQSVAKALFGSTARAVLDASHRPVLVVRPPEV